MIVASLVARPIAIAVSFSAAACSGQKLAAVAWFDPKGFASVGDKLAGSAYHQPRAVCSRESQSTSPRHRRGGTPGGPGRPLVGVLAAVGLVLYFVGTVIIVVRAGSHSHVRFPLVYMAPVVGSLMVAFAA